MVLDENQFEVVNSREKNIVVIASAACGKTRILSERVRVLLERDNVNPNDIAVITFTVAAAGEMRTRIGNYAGMYIGTMHGLAYKWLCDANRRAEAERCIKHENFDDFFELLMDNINAIKNVKYILIDEAQDMDRSMWKIIFDYMKPFSVFAVGDNRQVIYDGFRDVDADFLYELTLRDDFVTFKMNYNYRNDESILKFAKNIMSTYARRSRKKYYVDDSISKTNYYGEVESASGNINHILYLMKQVKPENYKDWFIISPTNLAVDSIISLLNKNGIPCKKMTRAGLTTEELQKVLEENILIVGTIHSVKGLERDNVVVYHPEFWGNGYRLSYVAATRAKHRLIWITK